MLHFYRNFLYFYRFWDGLKKHEMSATKVSSAHEIRMGLIIKIHRPGHFGQMSRRKVKGQNTIEIKDCPWGQKILWVYLFFPFLHLSLSTCATLQKHAMLQRQNCVSGLRYPFLLFVYSFLASEQGLAVAAAMCMCTFWTNTCLLKIYSTKWNPLSETGVWRETITKSEVIHSL